MEERFIKVSDYANAIKSTLNASALLSNAAVIGEVSGFKITGAHAYFTLKDAEGAVSCSCFNYRKTNVPKEGDQIVAVGSADFYVKGGRLNFVVSRIEPYGQGLIFAQIEALKKKLEAEGIFAEEHKKPIPTFCKEICVVTSKTGAVIRDIVKTIRLKNPLITVVVKDVRVQGAGVENEIAAALAAVDKLNFDCIILARGGGSLEDLMPFYTEKVVRALYNLKTPCISAIGHQTDFSLCDFVADLRAATPTAAGEAVAYDYYALRQNIFAYATRCNELINRKLALSMTNTKYAVKAISHKIESMCLTNAARVYAAQKEMLKCINNMFTAKAVGVDKLMTQLEGLSPIRTLKAGYFRIYSGDLPVISVKNVKVGDTLTARGADGKITVKVTNLEETDI